MKVDWTLVATVALFVWGAANSASRKLTDEQWSKIPSWLQLVIVVSRALGPDALHAYRKGSEALTQPK